MTRPWMRFYTVGLGGFGVQTLVLWLLRGVVGLHYIAATVIAVETAVLHNFYWHERWTWAHRNLDWRGTAARLLRFNAGNGLISLVGNVLMMWLLVSRLGLHYLVAAVAALGTCSLLNFLVSDRLIFREVAGPDSSGGPPEPTTRKRSRTARRQG